MITLATVGPEMSSGAFVDDAERDLVDRLLYSAAFGGGAARSYAERLREYAGRERLRNMTQRPAPPPDPDGPVSLPDRIERRRQFERNLKVVTANLMANPDAWWIVGTLICTKCGESQYAMQEIEPWMATCPMGECLRCGAMACCFANDEYLHRVVPDDDDWSVS